MRQIMAIEKSIQTLIVKNKQRICCPLPGQKSWNQHPRVYIDLSAEKSGMCPYCGTRFIVKENCPNSNG